MRIGLYFQVEAQMTMMIVLMMMMEVTFNTGLEDISKRILQRRENKSETVWEAHLRKRKEKRKAKNSVKDSDVESDDTNDDQGMDDFMGDGPLLKKTQG